MGFDITEIPESTITTGLEGKMLAFTGMNNVGKSYVAAHLFPGQTLWLATERGYNAQSGLRPYDIETWGDFRDAVNQLTTRNKAKRVKVREMYKCVVVDVADRLPALVDAYTVAKYNERNSDNDNFVAANDVGDIPYGAGYASSRQELDKQITKLTLAGYCVVLIFHEEIRKPLGGSKEDEYIVPKNTMTKTGNVLKDTPDFMIYVENQGVDEEGKPILSKGYTTQHKEFFARSRFTECPPEINPFTAENVKEMVRIACEREAEIQGATTVTYEQENEARAETKKQKKKSAAELVEEIKPVFSALFKAKQGAFAQSTMEQYLGYDDKGNPRKFDSVTENDVSGLQFIYNTLVDFAEEKGIEWDE